MTVAHWAPIALLIGSNVFVTMAWYGHLKFKESPLFWVILASWGIAFFEISSRSRPTAWALTNGACPN